MSHAYGVATRYKPLLNQHGYESLNDFCRLEGFDRRQVTAYLNMTRRIAPFNEHGEPIPNWLSDSVVQWAEPTTRRRKLAAYLRLKYGGIKGFCEAHGLNRRRVNMYLGYLHVIPTARLRKVLHAEGWSVREDCFHAHIGKLVERELRIEIKLGGRTIAAWGGGLENAKMLRALVSRFLSRGKNMWLEFK